MERLLRVDASRRVRIFLLPGRNGANVHVAVAGTEKGVAVLGEAVVAEAEVVCGVIDRVAGLRTHRWKAELAPESSVGGGLQGGGGDDAESVPVAGCGTSAAMT